MQFNVEISELAEEQYDNILDYLANVKKNPQAVNGVIDDFDYAIEELEKKASLFGYFVILKYYVLSFLLEAVDNSTAFFLDILVYSE